MDRSGEKEIWHSLRKKYDSGSAPPNATAYNVELDGGGRQLIHALLFHREVRVMLQIGCFLNGSLRRWLTHHPLLKIVGVDSWDDSYLAVLDTYIRDQTMIPHFKAVGDRAAFAENVRKVGFYNSAKAVVDEFGDKCLLVKGSSPDILPELKQQGFEPELIYIDADKKIEDLEACLQLWPDAILTGDDWSWGPQIGYPMRSIVTEFANKHHFDVFADRATWILRKRSPKLSTQEH